MSNSQSSSRFFFNRSLFALVEFGFGLLIALVGLFGLFPSVELNVAILIGIIAMLSLVLYLARLMIKGTLMEFPRNTRGLDGVLCVLLVSFPLFLLDLLSEAGVAILAIICGVSIILLSLWHTKFPTHTVNISENDIK